LNSLKWAFYGGHLTLGTAATEQTPVDTDSKIACRHLPRSSHSIFGAEQLGLTTMMGFYAAVHDPMLVF